MTFKQWRAVIMIVSQIAIAIWLWQVWDNKPIEDTSIAEAAGLAVWAIGAMVAINVAVSLAIVILVSIAQRREFKDESADERDRLVNARSGRNAYVVLSVSGLGILVALAWGTPPTTAIFALFAALMLAGTVDAVSKLAYYRYG